MGLGLVELSLGLSDFRLVSGSELEASWLVNLGELLGFVVGEGLESVKIVAVFPGNRVSGSGPSWVLDMLSVLEECQGLLVAVLLRILRMLAVGVVGLVIVGGKLSLMVVDGDLLLELLVVVPTIIWSFVWSVSEF